MGECQEREGAIFNPTFLIYFSLLGMIALMVFRWPAAAMGAVLSMYVLKQWAQSQSEWFMVNGSLTNFLAAGILGLALVLRLLRGDRMFRDYPRVGWIVIGLYVWAAFSIAWAVFPSAAVDNWKINLPMIVTFVLLMPLTVVHSRDLKIGLIVTLLVGSIVLLLMLLTSDWTHRGVVLQRGLMIGSVVSDRGNPLAIASMGGWLCLIAVLLNFRGMGRVLQVARWGIVVLGLIITYQSGSRGQLFALMVALLAFLPLSRRIVNIKGFVATAFTIIVFAVAASYLFDAVVESSRRWTADSMFEHYESGRLRTSLLVISGWMQSSPHYWLIGLGTSASFDPNLIGGYPHLVMAEVLAELGIIGFVLLWLVPIASFVTVKRVYPWVRDDPELRGLVATTGAMFLFEVVLSFKQGSMLSSWFAFAFAVLIGRLALAIRRERLEGGTGEQAEPIYLLPTEMPASAFGSVPFGQAPGYTAEYHQEYR